MRSSVAKEVRFIIINSDIHDSEWNLIWRFESHILFFFAAAAELSPADSTVRLMEFNDLCQESS